MAKLVPKVEAEKDVGGWSEAGKKGRPWVCSVQTLLKQETDPGDSRGNWEAVAKALLLSFKFSYPFLSTGFLGMIDLGLSTSCTGDLFIGVSSQQDSHTRP